MKTTLRNKWKPLDRKTLEYLGIEPRCSRCGIKFDNSMKGFSRSEKDRVYCERCVPKVELEESFEGLEGLEMTDLP